MTLNGGTLATTAGVTNTHAFTIGASGGTIDVTTTGQYFFNTPNTLLGSGTLTVTGNGTLTANTGNLRLAQTNTFSGNVILQSGGILEYGVASAIASAGTITINGQGEAAVNTGVSLPNAITINGGTNSVISFENGTTGVFSGNVTLNANATIGLRDWYAYGTSTSGTFSGVISGSGFGITTNPGTSAGGVVTLTNANTYTGTTVISAGTSVQLGGGSTTGSISTSSAITDNGTLIINRSNAVAQGTDFSGAALTGTGGFTQAGTGTTTLSASNTYSGNTVVNGGELSVTGGSIGNSTQILIGNNGTGVGAAMYQSGGTVTNTSALGGGFQIGSSVGAAGYYNLSSGTINVGGEIDPGGSAGGAGTFGEFDMSGGTVNLPAIAGTYFLPNRGAAGEVSVVNISGGTVQISGGAAETNSGFNGLTANWGTGTQTATITISGTGQFLTPSLTVKPNLSDSATNVTTFNLNGGTLQTLGFGQAVSTTPTDEVGSVLNFNGGTLKAGNATNTTFLQGLTAAYVYSGNGTIDNNGQLITIAQPLLTPTGSGVSSVTVGTAGSGYVVPPQVTFTGGTGSGATGYATISPTTGAVTGIVVTNPGNYSTAPTGITLTGNVASGGTAASSFTVNSTINVSGGVTFQGSGTTTLSNANTYTGDTKVTAGTLALSNNLAMQNSAFDTSGAGKITLSVTTPTFGGLKGSTNLATAITTGYSNVTALTLNPGTGATDTYSGAVVNGAAGMTLTKTGAGTQILSGSSSYTGSTTILGGTLRAANTHAFGSGALAIKSGGTLALGADASTVGALTTAAGTFFGGGTYTPKIIGAGTGAAGMPAPQAGGTSTTFDEITMSALTVDSSTSTTPFAIILTAPATPPTTTFDPTKNYDWQIASITGAVSGAPIGSYLAVASNTGANLPVSGEQFTLDTSSFVAANTPPGIPASGNFFLELESLGGGGESLDIGYNATPEPGTALLLLAGALPMLTSRRRRRNISGMPVAVRDGSLLG